MIKKADRTTILTKKKPTVSSLYKVPLEVQEQIMLEKSYQVQPSSVPAEVINAWSIPILAKGELSASSHSYETLLKTLAAPGTPHAWRESAKILGADCSGSTYSKFAKVFYRDGVSPAYTEKPIEESLLRLVDEQSATAVVVNLVRENFFIKFFFFKKSVCRRSSSLCTRPR